jgi:hypothetical protein
MRNWAEENACKRDRKHTAALQQFDLHWNEPPLTRWRAIDAAGRAAVSGRAPQPG